MNKQERWQQNKKKIYKPEINTIEHISNGLFKLNINYWQHIG